MPTGTREVYGVTVLNDEVFIVRCGSQDVETYDLNSFTVKGYITVKELRSPWDLSSCGKFRCLYIADINYPYNVHRVELNGKIEKWSVDDAPCGLSVTSEPNHNIIATSTAARTLKEFTTHGDLIREVLLPE